MGSCAHGVPAVAAAMIAAAQTPCINFLVSNMTLPSLLSSPGRRCPLRTSPACGRMEEESAALSFTISETRSGTSVSRIFYLGMPRQRIEVPHRRNSKGPSGRRDTEASDKWLRDDKPVIHDFQRQRRQTA